MLKWLKTFSSIYIVLFLFTLVSCDCPFPNNNLENGRFVYWSRKDVNETTAEDKYKLRIECNSGYERIGPRSIICIDAKWSPAVPTCKKRIPCPDPGVSKHGSRKGDCCSSGDVLQFSCHEDHELVGNSEIKCLADGSWSSERPLCRTPADYCEKPPEIRNGAVTGEKDGDYFIPNDVAEIECQRGFKYTGWTTSIKCVGEGEWGERFGECTEKESCPDPGVPKHGSRKGDCCFSDDILQFSCRRHHKLIGNSKLKCSNDGTWSSEPPLCEPIEYPCEYLKTASNEVTGEEELEKILCKPGSRYRRSTTFVMCDGGGERGSECENCIGFKPTFFCDDGLSHFGLESWSGKTPYSRDIRCSDPGAPENGERFGNAFEVGRKVSFKCSTGYELIGSSERYCKHNGQWTGEQTRCDASNNYCPNPGAPINGYKNSTSYFIGDKVGFRCQLGYVLTGSKVRECLSNRTWTGTETSCLGPYNIDNSAQVIDGLVGIARQAEQLKKDHEHRWEALHHSSSLGMNFPGRLVIYFAFDVSGSIGEQNFFKSMEFAKAIVKKVGISKNGPRAAALTFGSRVENIFLPLTYSTTEDVLNGLDQIRYTGGRTAAASALRVIRRDLIPLTEAVLGTNNRKSIIFLLTDGKTNMRENPSVEARALKEMGVKIYCIGITICTKKETFYNIASTSTGINSEHPNVYLFHNYPTMSWLVREIVDGKVDYSRCDIENGGNEISTEIIARWKRGVERYPWMAALYARRTNELRCGGSVIHRNFILTAAHCLYSNYKQLEKVNKSDIIVKLGLNDLQNEIYLQELEIFNMFIHPKHRPDISFDYDIALLQLTRLIDYNPFIRPICLPSLELPENSSFYRPGEMSLTIGFDYKGIHPVNRKVVYWEPTNVIKEHLLPIQSRQKCIQSLRRLNAAASAFTENMMCAGDGKGGNGTCASESGGPLMQSQVNSRGYLYWIQIGIVSWGIGCGIKNSYGFYTHVQKLRSWIDCTIEEAPGLE